MDKHGCKPPSPPAFDNNVAENWKRFKQKFDLYMLASGKSELVNQKVKVAILLNTLGDEGIEIFNTFKYQTTESPENITHVIKKFDEYCAPQKNIVFERHKFNGVIQKEGQTFDQFLTEIKTRAASCEFGDQEESLIRDRVVFGIADPALQEKLLREPNLNLVKAANYCRAAESSKIHARTLHETAEVHAIWKQRKKKEEKGAKEKEYDCKKCGTKHQYAACPAYKKTCAKCEKKNHFAKCCPDNVNKKSKNKKAVNEVGVQQENELLDNSSESELYVDSISRLDRIEKGEEAKIEQVTKSWYKQVKIEEKLINCKLDSGAEVSILPVKIFESLKSKQKVKLTSVTLVSFGNEEFKTKPVGEVTLKCKDSKENEKNVEFLLVEGNVQPILGLEACVDLELIKRLDSVSLNSVKTKEEVAKKIPEVFEGLGKIPGKHHIVIKENAIPVIKPYRRVPNSLNEKLKITLDSLEKKGIVSKVDHPTPWVNSLVIVEKPNGSLRICLDPQELNKVIQREHYVIPSDDITDKLNGKSVFSVVDMKDGFWQIQLDEESADLCTFSTPFGRYQFHRLPFGICSAPEIFQKKCRELFGDIQGVEIYFDDLIISGINNAEHDIAFQKVVERALKYNVKFNLDELQYRIPEVSFMGHVFSERGLQVDPNRVKAIEKMEEPRNKTELLRILGMAKYLAKFIPNMSKVTASLRNLTRLDVDWEWEKEHKEALTELKRLICTAPVLKYFDTKCPILIQTDASKDGLGATLMQDHHPIAFASRSLTTSEQRYAPIEKELMAIVFATEKFHTYIYGRKVAVHTDHKPLESIVKKDLNKVSARLQRMLLKLLKYNLDISYLPGKYQYIADALSRATLKDKVKDDPEMQYVVHTLVTNLPMSEEKKSKFREATKQDESLSLLERTYKKGWPERRNKMDDQIKLYWNMRNQLSFTDGLVFLEHKIIIPKTLRSEMLKLIHESHLGVEKSKRRARQIMFWPGMTTEIEQYILKCKICEKYRKANPKETLLPFPIPSRPWERIASDLFEFGGKDYLVIIDAYSNWLEICKLTSKSAKEVIHHIKSVFSRNGVPDTFISDNVPFASQEFQKFAREWNFVSKTSSPRYPQSNGLAEKGVAIAKNLLRKATEENREVYTALLEYRNTPLAKTGKSPAEMLMGRMLKTKLPTTTELLKPKKTFEASDREKMINYQTKQKKYFDINAKDLEPLKERDSILIRKNKVWVPGEIVEKHTTPRSYVVKDETGSLYRRNRKFLRKSCNNYEPKIDLEEIPDPDPQNEVEVVKGVTKEAITTRSGRVIKPPTRFKDYLT